MIEQVVRKIKKDINGILLLDKPQGLTSNAALQQVKRLMNARKAGHTGSLDPLATGMLPICFGEATKFSHYLLNADKTYEVTAQLGSRTTTADAEGEIIETRPVADYSLDFIEQCLAKFRGPIEQIPSMYSALKHNGQPLYKLARQGIDIERKSRPVEIFTLQLLEQQPTQLRLFVHCSKGTYVRNLVEDLGETLGCGAHVLQLRRLSVGPYEEQQMITLEQVQQYVEHKDARLVISILPVDTSVAHWPIVQLSESAAFYIRNGQAVRVAEVACKEGWVRLMNEAMQFLGVGEILDDGRIAPRRLVQKV